MLSSFWDKFLESLSQDQQKNPILYSVLKQTKPIELTDHTITISCENQGACFFLEKKLFEIEDKITSHLGKKIKVRFIAQEKKVKKTQPLFSYEPSREDIFFRSGLNNKYSFDNFAVSSSNQVAYAASQAVFTNLGTAYNPLFLYGGVGVGKTHLAQAVAHHVLEKSPQKKVFFCPGDQFTNELIESIRERSTPKFRRKYRHLNLLIVDDIQFIAGKQSVQEEFFHTFNSIVSGSGQLILTSDRPPSSIKNLEDRLRSRFTGGLTVDVQPPDFELRTAILLIKAKEKNIELDMEIAKIISERIEDSRALEGTLLSIYAKILGKKESIDTEAVESFFNGQDNKKKNGVLPQDVIRAVCSYYNVKQSHLKSPTRTDNLSLPRQIAMYILRTHLHLKLTEVAGLLKRRDHTTVLHAVNKIENQLIKNTIFKQEVDSIIQSLSQST